VLPYLGITPKYSEEEVKEFNIGKIEMPNLVGLKKTEINKAVKEYEFRDIYYMNEGESVMEQFPLAGDMINKNSDLILYLE
jgi:stage V sporulation protein D (sporulation-specific penicillin-binding protein)